MNVLTQLLHCKRSLNMIESLTISDFKCIHSANFQFKNLNVITGVNSSGKSSVIQSILLFSDVINDDSKLFERWSFESVHNRYFNAKAIEISLNGIKVTMDDEVVECPEKKIPFKKNREFFYLSENRSGPKTFENITKSTEIGDEAEYVMSSYFKHQNEPIEDKLITEEGVQTLSFNVDYWLKKILNDSYVNLHVEKISSEKLKVSYGFGELDNLEPTQLGAGVSYIAKVIIVCLQAKPGQTVIIENPEIHLHPAAQSEVGHFLAFIASKGIQVIVETHCEHLINRIQYEVFRKNFLSENVCLFYKPSYKEDFQKINIESTGHFANGFPSGFFDASLSHLLEIG